MKQASNNKGKLAEVLDRVSDPMLLAAMKRRPHLGGVLMTEHTLKQVELAVRASCKTCKIELKEFGLECSKGRRARAEAINLLSDAGLGLREISFGLETSTATVRKVLQRSRRLPEDPTIAPRVVGQREGAGGSN